MVRPTKPKPKRTPRVSKPAKPPTVGRRGGTVRKPTVVAKPRGPVQAPFTRKKKPRPVKNQRKR